MRKKKRPVVDIDDPKTWVKYRKGLCNDCAATCCRMPVEARLSDLVRMGEVDAFEADLPAKQIAKNLKRRGVIDHFNGKNEIFTLARRANSDCNFLDPLTRRCTIYQKRPDVCRKHPQVGPRPGFCAYLKNND